MYVTQTFFQAQLSDLQERVPIFLDRYRNLMLSYAFLRERIINNNSLDTYEIDDKFKHDLDSLYNLKSEEVENRILIL